MCVSKGGGHFEHCEHAGTDSLSVMQFLELPICAIQHDVHQKVGKAVPPSDITLAHSPTPQKHQTVKT